MAKALITIAYRHVIDSSAESNFEKSVFNASYDEFLLKSQAYNIEGKYKTFSDLKANDGRANSLHYKSGFAVGGFINALNNQIPFLVDTFDKPIRFETYSFEVIESNITDKTAHKIAILYTTDSLTLMDNIGEHMILAQGDKRNIAPGELPETFVLKMQHGISISTYL